MELIVVLGVFIISILMITEIFMIFNRSQKKILECQRLQNDISYTVEMMARSIRLGSIDYESYSNTVDNPEERLYLNDASGRKITFEKVSDESAGCVDAQSSPCIISGFDRNADGIIASDEKAAITSKGIKIDDLKFFIFPTSDPYFNRTCLADTDCTAGKLQCDLAVNLCKVEDQQPVITIVFSVTQATGVEPITMTLQTSVSSREYYR